MKRLQLPPRQSYTFVLKKIDKEQHFRCHPKNYTKTLMADRRLQNIVGRLARKLKRNPKENHEAPLMLY